MLLDQCHVRVGVVIDVVLRIRIVREDNSDCACHDEHKFLNGRLLRNVDQTQREKRRDV